MPATQPYQDLPPYARDFLMYLRTVRGRSQRTVEAYATDLRVFLRYMACYKNAQPLPADAAGWQKVEIAHLPADCLAAVTLGDVYGFLNYLADERGNSTRARARKVSCLRTFYHYLTTKAQLVRENPLANLDLPAPRQPLPKFLTLEESKEMLKNSQSQDSSRDYCMLVLFLNCGLRLSELCGINEADLPPDSRTLRILGKGGKERLVYLNDSCLQALRAYRGDPGRVPPRPGSTPSPLFTARGGRRIGQRRVQQIIERQLKACGLDGRGLSVHKLRHTAATLMHQYGHVDIRVLQEVLGHENLATTQIYTHISTQQLEQAMESSPLAQLGVQPPSKAKEEK